MSGPMFCLKMHTVMIYIVYKNDLNFLIELILA